MSCNLPEVDIGKRIDSETVQKRIDVINEMLRNLPEDPGLQAAVEKMELNYLPRQRKYEEQERNLAGRNSYAFTDGEATKHAHEGRRGSHQPTMCN